MEILHRTMNFFSWIGFLWNEIASDIFSGIFQAREISVPLVRAEIGFFFAKCVNKIELWGFQGKQRRVLSRVVKNVQGTRGNIEEGNTKVKIKHKRI